MFLFTHKMARMNHLLACMTDFLPRNLFPLDIGYAVEIFARFWVILWPDCAGLRGRDYRLPARLISQVEG